MFYIKNILYVENDFVKLNWFFIIFWKLNYKKMLYLEEFMIDYIYKNIQSVIFGFILFCFIIDYLIHKNQINNQIMYNKKLFEKLECKFFEVIKYMKKKEYEMDLVFEKYENYINTLDKQLIKSIKQNEISLLNLANYTDSLFEDKNEKHELKISEMEERLYVLFSENISKLEQKFLQYIEENREERKSIYCFYKTACNPKVFNGNLSMNDVIDAIFNHYFDINFDEEKDIIDKQIIIDSLSDEKKEKYYTIENSDIIISDRIQKYGNPFGY